MSLYSNNAAQKVGDSGLSDPGQYCLSITLLSDPNQAWLWSFLLGCDPSMFSLNFMNKTLKSLEPLDKDGGRILLILAVLPLWWFPSVKFEKGCCFSMKTCNYFSLKYLVVGWLGFSTLWRFEYCDFRSTCSAGHSREHPLQWGRLNSFQLCRTLIKVAESHLLILIF